MPITPDSAVAIALLQQDVRELKAAVEQQAAETKALVEAWKAATGVVKFMKLLATVIAAVSAIWLFLVHGIPKAP